MSHRAIAFLVFSLLATAFPSAALTCAADLNLLRDYRVLLAQYGTPAAAETAALIDTALAAQENPSPEIGAARSAIQSLSRRVQSTAAVPPMTEDMRNAHLGMQAFLAAALAQRGCSFGVSGGSSGNEESQFETNTSPGSGPVRNGPSKLSLPKSLRLQRDALRRDMSERPFLWLAVVAFFAAFLFAVWRAARRVLLEVQISRLRRVAFSQNVGITFEGAAGEAWLKAVDISQGGLKVACGEHPSVGTRVRLTLGHLSIPASVRWSNAHFMGLRFDDMLPEDTLNALLSPS